QELRIGNWLYRKGDNENMYEVDWITIKEAHNYQPIPITEEWLEKFGFEKESIEKAYFRVLIYSMRLNEKLIEIKIEMWKGNDEWEDYYSFYKNWDYMNSCQHIHQLQNLYYALTGEELKMKE
ncbi:MAG: hypothetical protein HRU26_17505, partial [Psychroserpens sp.]|nr:hypothetical protein [Psychroserpens sp.]